MSHRIKVNNLVYTYGPSTKAFSSVTVLIQTREKLAILTLCVLDFDL